MSGATDIGSAERPRRRLRFWRRRQQQTERRFPFDLRKALFILPNAFTVASIFCGFLAIMLAARGNVVADTAVLAIDANFIERLLASRGAEAFDRAGICLFLAAFFDAFDGRIARLTRTQSDFGVQMDSLADVISFGVAPAVLVYNWALHSLGVVGVVASFAFCACGAIRLARFNVLAARGVGSSTFFVGLPIPGASSMLITVIMAQSWGLGTTVEQTTSVLALVVILSYLMVSRIRFRTFKDFRPRMKTLPIVVAIVVAIVLGFLVFKARLALVIIVGCYVAAGLIEEVLFFKKRRAEATTTTPAAPQ
ncbi:MAG TPA: CDP-diacylglycerol--serine O-phosphatidyltransferase [Myxococcota bacterium]